MSPGPIPASSNAAAAASVVADGAESIGIDGANTSNEPNRRVRKATERRYTGVRVSSLIRDPRASTSATAPSPGEQNMYCVRGWLTILDDTISSSLSGVRLHAFGLRAPFAKAFDATL